MTVNEVLVLLQDHLLSLDLPTPLQVFARLDVCSCGKTIIVVSDNNVGGITVFHNPLPKSMDDVRLQIGMFTESLIYRLISEGLIPTEQIALVPEWNPGKITWLNTAVAPSSHELLRASELAALPAVRINPQKLARLKARPQYPSILHSHLSAVLDNLTATASASP